MKAFGCVACLILGAFACGSDDDGGSDDGAGDQQAAAGPCAAAPSFSEVTAFTQVCRNCHDSSLAYDARNGAPLGYDFDRYDKASDEADQIAEAVEQGYMPPRGYTLTEEQKAEVLLWVQCGAPE